MSLTQHLLELRKRLFIAALGVLAGAVLGFFLFEPAWGYLQSPMRVVAKLRTTGDAQINYTSISGAFDVRMQVAITIGLVVSSPLWLYQIFAFLVPGLNRREKRYVLGFFFTAIPLFLAGCATGFFVMPQIVELMTSFVPVGDASLIDAKNYLDFVLKLVLATGVAFVLPVFLVLLNFIGVLQGATILRSWRWAILAIALFTALATPAADVLSMFLLAIPMVGLYFAAVGVTIAHDRAVEKRRAAFDAELAAGA
ncbi:MAG: twin-arginine translocase subunit TatC [Micrococcales bacterium]|nr:twin-arginine translocase subunit TatC [Micrococcales bacterium]